MTRTTPPRPVDIARLFPQLRSHGGSATRLHPRPGSPAVTDSSVGGPLLWPSNEPWPVCNADHEHADDLRKPDGERLRRRTLSAAWGRTRRGQQLQITDEERAALRAADEPAPFQLFTREPRWMHSVAQLYRRDVPNFLGPSDADVLQMLWCPLDHAPLHVPAVMLRWRRSADVVDVLTEQPEPAVMEGGYYLPEPCVLHPEEVTDYAYLDLLPDDLAHQIRQWDDPRAEGYGYGDMAIAPGWKMGGFAEWGLTDPYPMICECGRDVQLLLAVGGVEWDPRTGVWCPLEGADHDSEYRTFPDRYDPTSVQIGRGYTLWIFYCLRSFGHPHQATMP